MTDLIDLLKKMLLSILPPLVPLQSLAIVLLPLPLPPSPPPSPQPSLLLVLLLLPLLLTTAKRGAPNPEKNGIRKAEQRERKREKKG